MAIRINNKQLNMVLLAGAKMANLCFNLSQRDSVPADIRKTMKECQEEWDSVYPRKKYPVGSSIAVPSPANPCMCYCHLKEIECHECKMGRHKFMGAGMKSGQNESF